MNVLLAVVNVEATRKLSEYSNSIQFNQLTTFRKNSYLLDVDIWENTYMIINIYELSNMFMNPLQLFKCLSDDTRLKSIMLITEFGEVCVCDLMEATCLEQPKISRHLAELRKCGVLLDERRGKWVYYRLHPELPEWAKAVITESALHNQSYFKEASTRLKASLDSQSTCC